MGYQSDSLYPYWYSFYDRYQTFRITRNRWHRYNNLHNRWMRYHDRSSWSVLRKPQEIRQQIIAIIIYNQILNPGQAAPVPKNNTTARRVRMKRKTNKLIIGIIFLAGLSLLLYPFVANQWNNYRQKQLISSYEQTVSERMQHMRLIMTQNCRKQKLTTKHYFQVSFLIHFAVAAASDKEDQSYMDALNIAGDGMMGIVEIPKIDIKLPIYHTTDEDVLKQAAGHLEGSSLQSAVKVHRRYLRTPWTSECVSFYRSGSAGRRRSFF